MDAIGSIGQKGQMCKIKKVEWDSVMRATKTLEKIGKFELARPISVGEKIVYFLDLPSGKHEVVTCDDVISITEIVPNNFLLKIGEGIFYKVLLLLDTDG
jgi:hypothetical protein